MRAVREDVKVASLLALAFALLYLLFAHGHFAGTDEVGVYEQASALYERGDLDVPQGKHVFAGKDGRLYSHFAVGQSFLALPFYAIGSFAEKHLPAGWVSALAGKDSRQGEVVFGGRVTIFTVGLYAPIVSALLVGLFFLFERRLGASLKSALLSAVLLGATTYVAMMSVFFLQHTTEALTILGGLYGFHAYRVNGRFRDLAAGSLVAALTILIRIPACVAGLGLAGYLVFVLRERARQSEGDARYWMRAIAAVAVPLAAVLAVHVAFNFQKWGMYIRSPFLDQIVAFNTPFYVGAWGFLLSPGCSIFLHSPLLLLLGSTLPPFWRERRAEAAAILTIALSFFVMCSKFEVWSGLYSSPGPRYLFVLTPLLMLPFGPWLDRQLEKRTRITIRVLAAIGVLVQLLLMIAHWGSMITMMQWQKFVPELSFVWIPQWSPLSGAVHALAQGLVDPWMWGIAFGRADRPGTPGVALVLFVLWAACFAASLMALRRTVRASTAGAK